MSFPSLKDQQPPLQWKYYLFRFWLDVAISIKKMTLMTGFVLRGHILLYSYDTIYNESNYTTFIN